MLQMEIDLIEIILSNSIARNKDKLKISISLVNFIVTKFVGDLIHLKMDKKIACNMEILLG